MRSSAKRIITPLQSWDIFAQHIADRSHQASIERDRTTLEKFKSQFGWNIDLSLLLEEKHLALVLTNYGEEILWVNTGFTKMTGYTKKEALGRHPRFLQGANTSQYARKEIRTRLNNLDLVTHKILNYKKDGSPYLCDIKIFPLINRSEKVTHFLALESKAKTA